MRHRAGCIDTDPRTGRHRVRIMVRGKRITKMCATLEEAEQLRASLLSVSADEYADGETLRAYGHKCLERREISRKIRDPQSDWSRWNNHIADMPIAQISIARLRRRHVKAWLRELQRKGLAHQTVKNTLNVLRVVVNEALDDEILKESPFIKLTVDADRRTEDAWSFLNPDQQDALVAALPAPERYIVQFAIWTGLRAGELACLRLADVGDEAITVRYGTPPDKPTKRGKIRRVPILHGARAALDQWRWHSPLGGLTRENPKALLFPRPFGGFRDPDHVLRWEMWDAARKAIGWSGCWHDLRHTCAASLVRGWWGRRWSLEEVCQMLGHASLTTTERYAHLADDILGEAARQTAAGREVVAAATLALKKSLAIPHEYPRAELNRGRRFRKPSAAGEVPRTSVSCDQMAASLLRAVAAGDPRALSMAVDLASAVLAESAASHPRPSPSRRGGRR